MDTITSPTALLDFDSPALASLIDERGWRDQGLRERVASIYDFVRNEIAFGYNVDDAIPASAVLADGYGQCNTKTTLLIALLRGSGVPARFHGATIHKRLQKGVVPALAYAIAPDDIIHSWAEVEIDGRWVELEGVILDDSYLAGLRDSVCATGPLLGYGAGTDDIASPAVEFLGESTAIQKTGVNADLGVFDSPDKFYAARGGNFSGVRAWLFRTVVRQRMNRTVGEIRRAAERPAPLAA